MSQNPLYAAPGELVSESSGTTPTNTSQERSMEANIEVLSLSDRDKGSHFPFMKLPVGMSTVAYAMSINSELILNATLTEIRLEIYVYLLIAAPPQPKKRKRKSPNGVVLSIRSTGRRYPIRNIECKRAVSSDRLCVSLGLTPQVLSTCREIHLEATSILYARNLFHFYFNDVCCMYKKWERDTAGKYRLEISCRELYHNSDEVRFKNASRAVTQSTLAVFMRQIGRQNAASLNRLKVVIPRSQAPSPFLSRATEAAWTIDMTTQLLKHHAPRVRRLKIYFISGYRYDGDCRNHWDDFEDGPFDTTSDGLKPSWDERFPLKPCLAPRSPFVYEVEKIICQAIADMVQEITWLKQLRIAGFEEDDPHRQGIEDLQALVKNRHRGAKHDGAPMALQ